MESLYLALLSAVEWVVEQLARLLDWILSGLNHLFVEILFAPVLGFISDSFHAIPLPDWYNYGTVSLGSAGYFIAIAEVPLGVTMILSAYVIRFAIRRLPVIG